MTDDRRWRGVRVQTWITVGVILALVGTGGATVSLSNPNSSPVEGGVPVGAADGPVVVFMEPADGNMTNTENPWIDQHTFQYNSSAGNMTVSSDGRTNATVVDIEGDWTRTEDIETNDRNLTFNPADKQAVVVDGGVTAVDWRDSGSVAADDGLTDFRYAADSTGYIEIGGLDSNAEFVAETGSGTPIERFETDSNGRARIQVPSSSETDVTIKTVGDPTITNAAPADGAQIESSETTLSADVSSPTIGNNQPVDVVFELNGEEVQSTTITSNQTVSVNVEPPLGETSNWSVRATDRYNQSAQVGPRSFQVPAQLEIYSETDPGQLLDDQNINVSVRFFPLSDSGDVVTREADNGVVNLTGLPADERFVVTVDSEGFVYRRIVINSLYETNKIYLLDENETASRIEFELEDPTGSFPPDETILYVEKPITVDGTTTYQTIAGDTFGASATFPAILRNDARYRLRVQRSDGSSERILGFYSVAGSDRETLLIQQIEPSAERNTGVVYGGLETENNSTQLAVRFQGGEDGTQVTYRVVDGAGDVVVPNTTTTAAEFAHIYPVNESGQYTVEWTIQYADGTSDSGEFVAGTVDGVGERLDADPQVLSLMSWVAILATLGLVVIVDPKLAPAAGTGMATFLTILGTVAIPAPMLGVSGAIAALTLFGGRQ